MLEPLRPGVEFNIEGDPRPDLIDLVHEVRPEQCTIVPVMPGEVTSQAGWTRGPQTERLPTSSRDKAAGIRVSLFVDPTAEADRACRGRSAPTASSSTPSRSRAPSSAGSRTGRARWRPTPTRRAGRTHGHGVNAGHDLDLENLVLFRDLPHLDEVSIGHAIISRALFVGLETVVREYLAVLDPASAH